MAAVSSKSQPATTCNSPILRANSKIFNHINGGNNNSQKQISNGSGNKSGNHLSHSATEMAHLEYSSGQSTNTNGSFPFIFQHRYVATSPSDQGNNNPMSPTISSATSVTTSEVSLKIIKKNLNVVNASFFLPSHLDLKRELA